MIKRIISTIVISSAASWSTLGYSESTISSIISSGEIKSCFDAGYVPFEMKSKKGDYIGFDIDIMKLMAKKMGVKFVPVNTAWDGIIASLITKKCDIIAAGMTITAERNLKINFANPYITVGQTVLLNPKIKDEIKSYKDLNDPKYTLTTKIGTSATVAMQNKLSKAKSRLFESQDEAALEVINGNADALVFDLPYNALFAAQNKGKVVHLDQPFTYEPLGWAVRAGDPDFLNFLNNFLNQIKGDGSYDRIYNKWFNDDAWLSQVQ